jgi:hypothetical protein
MPTLVILACRLRAANVSLQLQQARDADTKVILFGAHTSLDAQSKFGLPMVAFRGTDVNLIDKAIYTQLFRMQPNAGSDVVAVAAIAVAAKQTKIVVLRELSPYAESAHPTLDASLQAAGIEVVADIQLRQVWDNVALLQALSTAKAAVVDERGSHNDVGTFAYIGADVALFERTMVAAATLGLAGAPYLWIVTRALLNVTGADAPQRASDGMIALAPYASDEAYAYDAVLVVAAALSRVIDVDRGLFSNTTIAAALAAVRVANGLQFQRRPRPPGAVPGAQRPERSAGSRRRICSERSDTHRRHSLLDRRSGAAVLSVPQLHQAGVVHRLPGAIQVCLVPAYSDVCARRRRGCRHMRRRSIHGPVAVPA